MKFGKSGNTQSGYFNADLRAKKTLRGHWTAQEDKTSSFDQKYKPEWRIFLPGWQLREYDHYAHVR